MRFTLFALMAVAAVASAQDEALFWIGKPDGLGAEFGTANQGQPAVFTVGKDPVKAWPSLQRGPLTISFTVDKTPSRPLYLSLGFTNTSSASPLTVLVNGKEIVTRDLPFRPLDESLDPLTWSNPSQAILRLPPGAVHTGENTITVKLGASAWVIYDYVYLGTNGRPPQITTIDPNLLKTALAGPMAGVQDIVFAARYPGSPSQDGHWYANFGYYGPDANRKAYGKGGKLYRLNLASRKLTALIDDPEGGVRDPQVSYDGKKILFAYRKGGSEQYHLYEINADGAGLRQLTNDPFDDFEPTYLPDGDIVFLSSRAKRWVNCWLTQVATMYRCNANGRHIRAISGNTEQDNTPWPLADGRLLYTRWEYVDRSQVHYHHLWASNPDGTAQTVFFGNMYGGVVMIDAKPVPNSDKVVAIFSPGHGRREHAGHLTLVDPRYGPDERSAARRISKGPSDFKDPWAFSEDCFLTAKNASVVLLNGRGDEQEIFSLSPEEIKAGLQLNEPRPLIPRQRERVIPPRVNLAEKTGQLVLSDVYNGRHMEGVKRGEIKKLLVLESLPIPVHFSGGMEPISMGGTFTLERILGTVPVEPDGSAYFELPALRQLFFVALDANDLAVKRMQSFTSVEPGEVTSCVGCHEQRVRTPAASAGRLMALARPVSRIEPITDVPDVFDFPRDIQPILDRHCVRCHDYPNPAGNAVLSGGRGPMYSHSYFMLTIFHQVADGRDKPQSNYPPRALGSSASPLMQKLEPGHHGVSVTPHEKKMVRLWIESGAPYPGTYAALHTGIIGDYVENKAMRQDLDWPSTSAGSEAIRQRCAGCHTNHLKLPLSASDDTGGRRHMAFNLSQPEKSLMLMAPLAREAGGWAKCKSPVFTSTADPDYQKILALITEARDRLNRFDTPGFHPGAPWVREMKRYGILAETVDTSKIDVYAIERKYWESLWYKPE